MILSADDEWSEASLEDVARPDAPIGYGIVQPGPYVPGGIPTIAIRDLPRPAMRTVHRSSPHIESRYRRSRVAPDDILISVKGTTGRVGLVPNDFEGNISRDVARVRLREEHEPRYWFQLLRSAEAQEILQLAAVGTTRQELSIGTLKKLSFRFPDRKEQEKIAEILAETDDLIVSIERSIAKRRAIKQGMMQRLLTGSTRLPGFGNTWRPTTVKELLEFKNGLNKASQYFGSGTPIVNFMDVMHGPIITAADVAGRVTLTRDEIKRFSAKRGDLFFTRTSETVDEVGTAAVLVDDVQDAAFSGFILRGRPRTNDSDSRFLAHLFQLDTVRKQITATATYTTRALTNGRSLGMVAVRIPASDEQCAIADVIADSDAEIVALRGILDKARQVKLGMMQQLLTGRIRLPV